MILFDGCFRRLVRGAARALWGGAPLLLLVAGGCRTAPPAPAAPPVRAVWVTRGDYRSADDVTRIMENCRTAGFNTVIFQVRGNGTAFYRSSFEPWADELGGADPGWDPLAHACREARARSLQLQAWVNVMPAWRGRQPPANPEQLYHRRPEWFWYDQYGNRQALCDFYVSLNPCLPEVRAYLVDVFQEIVANYDIDGLHLDYIRFPNEPPATPPRSDIDYPYDPVTLALYREETGKAPADDKAAWDAWRTAQVTRLVSEIRAMVKRTKPQVVLTAAVGAVPDRALRHFQDGRRWAAEGLVDAVYLMNYTDSIEEFERRIGPWLTPPPRAAVVPGPWFGRHSGKTPQEAAEVVKQQIEIARRLTGNFCLFSYAGLFETRERAAAMQPTLRQQRQAVLLPYLAGLDR